MRQVVVSVIPDGASFFEASTPIGVWGAHRAASTGLDVELVACGIESTTVNIEGGLSIGGLELLANHVARADLVVVPTWPVATTEIPPRLTELLLTAHNQGSRIVGLCLGAFAVAATGLLDGQSAVTHWRSRDRFEQMFPAIRFEPNTLYVDNGTLVTSAGSAAAIDCCIHLVRLDHGAEVAAAVARSMVTAPHRTATQSQFAAAPELSPSHDSMSNALASAAGSICTIRSVGDLASLAGISRRSIERHLRDRLGTSPSAWLKEQRLFAACRLLETTDLSVEEVSSATGFGSAPSLRRAFSQHRGTTPTAYRKLFREPHQKLIPAAMPAS